MSTVQYIARITCDCGAVVEGEAHVDREMDAIGCDCPAGWTASRDGWAEPTHKCPECSAESEAECLARLQAEVVEDGNYLRFSRVLTIREVRVWQAYMATARPCSVAIDGLIA